MRKRRTNDRRRTGRRRKGGLMDREEKTRVGLKRRREEQ